MSNRQSGLSNTSLRGICKRVAIAMMLFSPMISMFVARAQAGQDQTPVPVESRRSKLERELGAERQSGKTAEDPSIQDLEDQIMQARMAEDIAKVPQGVNKGPKQFLRVPVLYATNRVRAGSSYSDEPSASNALELGIANITIDISNGVRTDYLPSARFISKRGDAGSLEIIHYDNWTSFQSVLRKEAQDGASPRKILLYVHGFNTSFADAVERTALIATELQSPIVPVAYSWPSAGSIFRYSHDEDLVRASTEAFEDFLKQLIRTSPAEIVIVCHSMGAREVTSALSDLAKEKVDPKKLSRVIYVAADIYTSEFQSKWPDLSSLRRINYTFYASDSDKALVYSFYKHDADRLGFVNPKLWPPPGAATIDASNVDSIMNTFGHSYIDNPQLGADIGNWITTGFDPLRRGLLDRSTPKGTIYFFP